VLATNETCAIDNVLKLSAAFGGANAALVLGARNDPRSTPPRFAGEARLFLSRAVHTDRDPDVSVLAVRIGAPADKVARTDALTRLALAALADLRDSGVSFAGAGLVVGHSFATMETNAAFQAGIARRGAALSEPRRFPYTSPNAVAGDCSVHFVIRGPTFAVGSGIHGALEAVAVAAEFVLAGDAESMLVVAVDEVGHALGAISRAFLETGEEASSGAVAVLISRNAGPGSRALSHWSSRVETAANSQPRPRVRAVGHRALLPLVFGAGASGAIVLRGESGGGFVAEIEVGACS